MNLIKLDATDSTNAYLKKLILGGVVDDFTVVQAYDQVAGRGQMGTKWISEPGKNLTFSILKKYSDFLAREQFTITMATSLAVLEALSQLHIPDLKVKWPNDILSGSSKICGILIENLTAGQHIQYSIIGIGLNVNQQEFGELKQVSSLQLLKGQPQELDEIMGIMLRQLAVALAGVQSGAFENYRENYEKNLFRKGQPSTFRNTSGDLFMGIIRGVSPEGKLLVETEGPETRAFDLKEVQLQY